jgi:hypothetical protein
MFFDIPVSEGADTFFWIVAGLVGLINAIAFIDKRNTDKESDSNA